MECPNPGVTLSLSDVWWDAVNNLSIALSYDVLQFHATPREFVKLLAFVTFGLQFCWRSRLQFHLLDLMCGISVEEKEKLGLNFSPSLCLSLSLCVCLSVYLYTYLSLSPPPFPLLSFFPPFLLSPLPSLSLSFLHSFSILSPPSLSLFFPPFLFSPLPSLSIPFYLFLSSFPSLSSPLSLYLSFCYPFSCLASFYSLHLQLFPEFSVCSVQWRLLCFWLTVWCRWQ